jgi:HAD superfamily hydrolase (TIGR01662 family)
MIKGIIFDLGGTLIYSNHDYFELANAWSAASFLRSQGFSLDPKVFSQQLVSLRQGLAKEDDQLRQINTTQENLSQLTKSMGLASESWLTQCEKAFVTPEASASVMLPDIPEVVAELSKKFLLGIISNTRSHLLITKTLKYCDLSHYFNPVVTSVSAGYRKPSPKVFQIVLDAWKVSAAQVVMIGDSVDKDMAGAKVLGMKTIWLRLDSSERMTQDVDAVAEESGDILKIIKVWHDQL